MSRKPLISMASFNPNPAGNINRMTLLMSISEITPQIYISGNFVFIINRIQNKNMHVLLQVKWLQLSNKYKNWALHTL